MNKLEFEYRDRKIGSNQTPRRYLDFIVDGTSLKSLLNSESADLISPFSWRDKENELKTIEEFRLKRASELDNGRVMIYVCPECMDIGCGAITAKIHKRDGAVVWSDFAFENGETLRREEFKFFNELQFDKHQYYHAFEKLI